MKSRKKIYIILTYTGTLLSRMIKMYTKAEYSHVSISLEKNLNKMYSFGRLNPYNPFIGGFVQEGLDIGTFKRFKKTKAEIYSIEVTSKQFNDLKNVLKEIEKNKSIYRFNTLGIFAAAFNIKLKREKCFYCAEFVKHLIESTDANILLPELIKPIDFKYLDNIELVYRGVLRNYKKIKEI